MQEWYLMTPNTRPNLTGGFESDIYLNYKDDVFSEVLGTDIATTVTLYNSDLSKSIIVKSVIQNNVADSQSKSVERQCLFQIDILKDYIYLYFENNYWLIKNYVGNNGLYEKAIVELCSYTLKFQSRVTGTILSYPCIQETNSLTAGIDEGEIISTGSGVVTIKLPIYLETKMINVDDRFFIDDLSVEIPQVFAVSKVNRTEYRYGDRGIMVLTMKQDTYNKDTDNKELGVCNYCSSPTLIPVGNSYSELIASGELCIGATRTLTATAYNADKTINNTVSLVWNVILPIGLESHFVITKTGNICTIKIIDNDYETIDMIVNVSISDGNGGFIGTKDMTITA